MDKFFLDRKYRTPAIVGFCALLALVLVALVVTDIRGRFRRLNQDRVAAEMKMARLLEIQRREKDINAAYGKFASYLKAGGRDPRQVIEELLREVERAAKESGISILNLGPQSVSEDPKRKKTYKADLRFEGAPEKVVEFLRQVEHSRFLIQVVKMSLNTKDETAALLKGEMTIELAVE